MKNLTSYIIVVLMLFIPFNLFAQQEEEVRIKQVYLGYGFLSDAQIIALFSNTYSKTALGISGEPQRTENKSIGPFIIGYEYYVSKRISIGPELNLMNLTIHDEYSDGTVIEDRFFFTNLSIRFNFYYYEQNDLKMFSGLSLGATYISDLETNSTEDNSTAFLAYQINLLGLQYGKKWSGFIVFGFGRNGLMNLGILKRI